MTDRFRLSPYVDLRNDRIDPADGERQLATADEICRRLNTQPGVILADDVGMGKTFVAFAVAASVIQAEPDKQVVVMVPSAVGDKWPKDWTVFQEQCLHGGPEVRATSSTISRASEFLKLLDDPTDRRKQLIFLTHRALSSNLDDPFVKLALIRQAFSRRQALVEQKKAFPRWANRLLQRSDFTFERVKALLDSDPSKWQNVWRRVALLELDDDPVPMSVMTALGNVDLDPIRVALIGLPLRSSATLDDRLARVRAALKKALQDVWKESLKHVETHLPLLILDEAHHLKNPTQLRGLFDIEDGSSDESVRGAFGGVFERMMLMTATPFQLGHRELVAVLKLFTSVRAPVDFIKTYEATLASLGKTLDHAQASALRLEQAWAGLRADDLAGVPTQWWKNDISALDERAATAARFAGTATEHLANAAKELRPWVVRHTKPRRRTYLPGAATLPTSEALTHEGLSIEQQSILPFLLAARAQSYVALQGLQGNKRVRALFADGLASSFEAYIATRKNSSHQTDDAQEGGEELRTASLDWYLDQIQAAIPDSDRAARSMHPKIHATVERALHHWIQGEKVLVFCFYRQTGRALQEHLSTAIAREVVQLADTRFGIRGSMQRVLNTLSERSDTVLKRDSPGGRLLQDRVRGIAQAARLDEGDTEALADVTLRFMRTPSFLVRYVDLNETRSERAIEGALSQMDGSGVSLGAKLAHFASRVQLLTQAEREGLWDALRRIDTGSATDGSMESDDSEELGLAGSPSLPNVRRAHGATKQETRVRLMLAFNSPFLPEILVASSVMAEGVDLHRECRHIIHHDLDWNPSTLEQRTGRVDRLGSKSSVSGRPIVVCEPYVAGTQDEKQYKVVKDRERWFGVLMGGRVPNDEWATDQIAQRVPIPEALLDDLTLDLSVWPLSVPVDGSSDTN